MGPRAGLVGCGKISPPPVRSPDRAAHSESLYRLSYASPQMLNNTQQYSVDCSRGFIHSYPQLSTVIYSYLQLSTVIYSYPQLSTVIHSYLQLSTVIHSYPQLSTVIHSYLQLSPVIYSYPQLSTVIYSYLFSRAIINTRRRIITGKITQRRAWFPIIWVHWGRTGA